MLYYLFTENLQKIYFGNLDGVTDSAGGGGEGGRQIKKWPSLCMI